MNKRARTSTPTHVNVQSTTTLDSHGVTASDTWLSESRYLEVDSTLRTHQALEKIMCTHFGVEVLLSGISESPGLEAI